MAAPLSRDRWFAVVKGFPGGKDSTCQCRRCGFDSWVRKITWRRKGQPTPVFLTGKPHRQRSLLAIVHGVAKH